MPRPFKPIVYEEIKGPVPAGRPGVANPIDIHIGLRIRGRRIIMGLTQKELGALLGLTFQQIQKYERGANRVGASRLWDLGRVLNVPVQYFFESMPDAVKQNSPRMRAGVAGAKLPSLGADTAPTVRAETLKLVRAYYRIKDPKIREQVFQLIKTQSALGA